MSASTTKTVYLASGRDRVCALYDEPQRPAAEGRSSVLLCPLFGNDELCAYRARREWAKTLAAAGHPTLRFDLPGSGDSSGGPREADRPRAWTDAVMSAAAWLREQAPQGRLTAIGIGLGGMLAWCAAAEDGEIGDLVLWAVPSRGRTLVRQLRALARMEASRARREPAESSSEDDGSLSVAGFFVSAQTVAALEQLDLAGLELPRAERRRALLLTRDGLEPDERLHGALEAAGAQVRRASGAGYGAMVAPPQESRAPSEVFETVGSWLSGPPPAGSPVRTARPAAPHSASFLELRRDGRRIRERPITIEHRDGTLYGVLAEPESPAPLCAVLLGAGALRHVGPGRMWVEQARSWAARGVPSVRIDLAGIGDADGNFELLREDAGFYVPGFVGQTLTVLDELSAAGLPERFILGGLCSGAYWSLHAAVADERVSAVCMLNPRALVWDASLQPLRYARLLASGHAWRRFLRGELNPPPLKKLVWSVAASARIRLAQRLTHGGDEVGADQLEGALDELERRDVEVLGVFTAREPLLEELERDGRLERMLQRPNVRIERIPGPLVSHTLEPLALQRAAHEILDELIDRSLARSPGRATATSMSAARRRQPALSGRATMNREGRR